MEFGTGGLRGCMGAGTNRMNINTVNKATQGLCDFLKSKKELPSVAIAFDSRIKSEQFARSAAGVIAANGAKAYIFSELMPTPVLSYAVRELECDAGIVITASHNPAEYNGYKVYGSDGCQITLGMAESIQRCIKKVDIFDGVKKEPFEKAVQEGFVHFVSQDLLEKYLDEVMQCSINPEILKESDLKVIYTPLNGTGNKPVREILSRAGLKNLTVVPEQENPDGHFPTCQNPNPEERSVFKLAIGLAEKIPADLLLATDPDCDRVGIAVKNGRGYTLLTGNETGCLLLSYILSQKKGKNRLPESPVIIKTIVTSAMVYMIAREYGAQVIDTLTGFKYIGEQIGLLEQKHKEGKYVFGFEESYGYLPETFVRDKDAVSTTLLICEMAAFYKKNNSTLLEELEKLYEKHGFWKHKLLSFSFEGADGMKKMKAIINNFRNECFADYAGLSVIKTDDYLNSVTVNGETSKKGSLFLPKSDVVLFSLEKDCEIVIRPSGTEPKLKCYLTVKAKDSYGAIQMLKALETDLTYKIKLL
ncbi:MAG: phospho-sugar mutase [Lutispora sp.]|nr:phospho-sugar mutase [Lutispora sp.]